MSVKIETYLELKTTLYDLVYRKQKQDLFNGIYQEESDELLYEGLVKACDISKRLDESSQTYQEVLKYLQNIEKGCMDRLKVEYRNTFHDCMEFLSRKLGQLYLSYLERSGGSNVKNWLDQMAKLNQW